MQGAEATKGLDAEKRKSLFLSRECFFDLQMCIEGFLGLLKDQELRHGSVDLVARKFNQVHRATRSSADPPLHVSHHPSSS
jgi:hypothetical protein